MQSISIHFPFKDWKLCRAKYDVLITLYPFAGINLIISTHFYSSGYWIENKISADEPTRIVYATPDEVNDLFNRVEEVEKLKAEGSNYRSGLIT